MEMDKGKIDEVDNLVIGILDGLEDTETEIREMISIAENRGENTVSLRRVWDIVSELLEKAEEANEKLDELYEEMNT